MAGKNYYPEILIIAENQNKLINLTKIIFCLIVAPFY
jgi:hypothetical protein